MDEVPRYIQSVNWSTRVDSWAQSQQKHHKVSAHIRHHDEIKHFLFSIPTTFCRCFPTTGLFPASCLHTGRQLSSGSSQHFDHHHSLTTSQTQSICIGYLHTEIETFHHAFQINPRKPCTTVIRLHRRLKLRHEPATHSTVLHGHRLSRRRRRRDLR